MLTENEVAIYEALKLLADDDNEIEVPQNEITQLAGLSCKEVTCRTIQSLCAKGYLESRLGYDIKLKRITLIK